MAKLIAGAVVQKGECGEDDLTPENLEQMADTLEARPPTMQDRRELVEILRWMAGFVRSIEESGEDPVAPEPVTDDVTG